MRAAFRLKRVTFDPIAPQFCPNSETVFFHGKQAPLIATLRDSAYQGLMSAVRILIKRMPLPVFEAALFIALAAIGIYYG